MSRADEFCDRNVEQEYCKHKKDGEDCPCAERRDLEAKDRSKRAFWGKVGLALLGLLLGFPAGVLIVRGSYQWAVAYGICVGVVIFLCSLRLTRAINEAKPGNELA